MNRKPDYAAINRAMRRVPAGAQNPLLRSIHLSPAATPGLEVISDAFTGEEDGPEAARKIQKLQAQGQELVRFREATTEQIGRIASDLEKATKSFDRTVEKQAETAQKAEEALAGLRAMSGTVPSGGDQMSRSAKSCMVSLARAYRPDKELLELVKVQSIDPSYFSLVTHTPRQIKEHGVPEEVDRKLARFRLLNDVLFVLNKYFSARDSGTYAEMGGMRGLPFWKEWEELCKAIRFADLAEGGSTTGGAWVPTIWSGNLINLVQLEARSVAFFETFPMQSLTHKQFVEGADAEGYYIPEGTSITQSDFTTFDATWVARKIAARAISSREVNQDSAIPFVQEIERKLAKAIARATENLLWNGQATGSTAGNPGSLDSGSTIHATNGDIRLLSNGLRYWHAQTGLGVKDAGAGLTIEACAKLRGPMGPYGDNPAEMGWFCSAWGAAHIITIRTEDGRPVLLSPRPDSQSPPGTVGRLLDSEIVLSSYIGDNYNASGVIDGAGATTAIYYPNRPTFKFGERLGIIVEASTHRLFETDQIMFKAVRRLDLQPVRTPSSSEPAINAIGNLPLS